MTHHAGRILALVLLLALSGWMGCGRKATPKTEWPLGFHLEVDPAFKPSGTQRPNGEGSLFFLRGDQPDQPRLVVRKRQLRRSLEETLQEVLQLGDGPRILEQWEPFRTDALNASGLGMCQRVQLFPEMDSTLILLFDTRVFLVGDFSYTFVWQQVPQDSAARRQYEGWMRHLRFALPEPPGQTEESPATERH